MAIPSVDLCGWAVTDVILPVMNKANKEKPIDDLINKGWDMNESPAADEFNYLFNNHYQWINYLKTDIAPVIVNATSSNTPNTIVKRDGSGNFSAGTITAYLQGTAATAENNSHTHVSSNITDATASNTPSTLVKRDASGDFSVGTITGNLNGTAQLSVSATKLQTARTITLSGSVSGTASFDGSSNININTTANGYASAFTETDGGFTLPNGVICKWTKLTIPPSTSTTWTFGVPFPNNCLNVQVTLATAQDEFPYIISKSASTVVIDTYPGADSVDVFVLAYGY